MRFVPQPNAVGVPIDVVFRITFDDYPDPDTVRSDSLLLTTGFFWVPGTYGVDLIGKAAVVRPISWLAADLGYSLHLRPALASLAGCPGTSEEIEFITGTGPANEPPPQTAPFAQVQEIFAAKCAERLPPDRRRRLRGGGRRGGLSLCAPEAWADLVVRRIQRRPTACASWSRATPPAATCCGSCCPRHRRAAAPGVAGHRDPPGEPLQPSCA